MIYSEKTGRAVENSDLEIQYDAHIKRLLSDKTVLAFILHYIIKEFTDLDIQDIAENYIKEVKVRKIPLEPGDVPDEFISTNPGTQITGSGMEDSSITEDLVCYDILFTAQLPAEEGFIELIINVEGQNHSLELDALLGRAIFDLSCLVSAQEEETFISPSGQGPRKFYAIWILSNPETEYRNTVDLFSLHYAPVTTDHKYPEEYYDKMSVVLINLSQQIETDHPFLSFLNILLSRKLDGKTKKELLKAGYNFDITQNLEEEMKINDNLLKSYAYGFYLDAKDDGLQEGRIKGRLEGRAEGLNEAKQEFKSALERLVHHQNTTVEALLKVMDLDPNYLDYPRKTDFNN